MSIFYEIEFAKYILPYLIARQLILLRKGFATEFVDIDRNVCIACQVNHDACPQSNISVIQTVSKQNSFLFSTCSSRCLVAI